MFRLDTFGGLTLLDPAGAPVPTPRRRLALLTLLAVAGARGLTRDKVVAYLWPESTTENARHALEQLLYSLRRQGARELVTGGDPLRLNPALVTSDVALFERAVAGGDLDEAAALYRGPFLDGFFLSDAPEFEEWVEGERTRLARAHTDALYALAKQAGARGQHTAEIACWRKLSTADPMSERSASGLARALAAAGEWSAALEHSRAYDEVVRRELREERSTLTALVEKLRTEGAGVVPEAAAGPRYAIEREVGRGSMATVYLARDRKLGRQVALKLLRPELAVSTARERFHREIAILASLHHPHILQIHDSGELEPGPRSGPFFVMPFVHGESLRERLRREVQLPVAEALALAEELADALGYAHARGIIHRDVKPENILLEGGHALLADFGVAFAVDLAAGHSLSVSGVRLGAPGYMSPEQAIGPARADARSDLYSLGCVVYEMLTGEPPFSGATSQALVARHATDAVPPMRTVRPDLPAGVEAAVRKALAKTPGERYGSAGEFAAALRSGWS
jgi:DNA-binding SARP family transcriptional activator/tRNA A-37 threonylcarbamoyl transferase component Bud32